MAAQETGTAGRRGLRLAAEIHAFRTPPARWAALLDAARDAGFSHVATLAPFAVHEPRPGEQEFGALSPSADLAAFLELAAARGLRACVRVGPRLRADLAQAGLPDHVAWDKASMARSARGGPVLSPMPPRMFPWPSTESATYRAHVARFLRSVAEVLRPFAERGVLDTVEVEDPAAVVLRAGAFARDYHPDSVAAFRRYLAGRYGDVTSIGDAWGIAVRRFEDVDPPTRFAATAPRDLPRLLDWAAFQEASVHAFRLFVAQTLRDAGLLSVELTCCLDALALGTTSDAAAAVEGGLRAGVELVTRADETRAIRRRMTSLAQRGPAPFARVVVGGSPFGRARSDDDAVSSLLLAVGLGARAIEVSPFAQHERWWGAPLDAGGAPTSAYGELRKVLAALRALELHTLSRRADVVVLVPPGYARLARVSHLFGPFGAGILDFVGRSFAEATRDATLGFSRPIAPSFVEQLGQLESAADAAGLDYDVVSPGTLRRRETPPRLVLVPTYEFLDDETAEALAAAAAAGAHILGGPTQPTLDGAMRGARHAAFTLLPDDPAAAAEVIDAEASRLGLRRLPRHQGVFALPLERDGVALAYVVVNPTESRGTLALADATLDVVTGSRLGASAPVELVARSARLLVVERVEPARPVDPPPVDPPPVHPPPVDPPPPASAEPTEAPAPKVRARRKR